MASLNVLGFCTFYLFLLAAVLPVFSQNQNFGFAPVNQRFQQQQPQQNFQQFQQQRPQNNQQVFHQPPQNQQVFQQPPQNQQVSQQAPQNQQVLQQTPQNQQPQNSANEVTMSDSCLACICQASTSCKLATPCTSNGFCGPFLLSKPYWIDSGRPTLIDDSVDREGAFEDCSTDPICAAQTVRKYMNKFKKDCNADVKIDCDDLARIHLMGPFDCANPNVPTSVFYRKFQQCWNRVLQLTV